MTTFIHKQFMNAVRKGNAEQVREFLYNHNVDPSSDNQDALQLASVLGQTEIVRILLEDPRVDPSVDHQWAVINAVRKGNVDIVRLFLADPRVDPSVDDSVMLYNAVHSNNIEIVKILLADPRVDPSLHGQEALTVACYQYYTPIVRLLLADPRVNPRITPEKALILQTIDVQELLHTYGTNIPQFLISVDNALEKESLRQTAKGLVRLQTLEAHNKIFPNIANRIGTFYGNRNRRKTISNSLENIKGNYYGPKREGRKSRKNIQC